MAITKTITIGGKDVIFKASAAIPRIYRIKFKQDIFKDIQKLARAIPKDKKDSGSNIDINDLELFENVAYTMAKHADPSVPSDIYVWLDEFAVFDIYTVLPQIIELWGVNIEAQAESKKKLSQVQGS